jgi:pyruvate dehydrogenase E2 component (dihydrolipoamide acetyltransferase)
MESGSISAWNVKAGDTVAAGDVFASIETDKAVVDFEAQDDGIIAQILVPAGTEVKVNSPVMILVNDPNHVAAFENYTLDNATTTTSDSTPPPPTPTEPVPVTSTTSTPPAATAASSVKTPGDKVFASPLARKLAQDMGYDISIISGTGPSGRIIAADVKEYKPIAITTAATTDTATKAASTSTAAPSSTTSTTSSVPIPGSGYVDYPIPSSVSDVAARLAQSKRNVPHYYLTVDINVDALLQLRQTINKQLNIGKKKDATETSIGVYEFLIKAAGLSMRTIPSANAAWMDTHVRVYDSVDVNIVTGAGQSLSVNTIRNINAIGIQSISNELMKINHENDSNSTIDHGLGTFTMINVGMYGVKSCAPIIREPQACAIAIGTIQPRIVPSSDSEKGYQQCTMFTVTASFDHRVVDGAVGAQWLAAFKSYIENPNTLLL